MKLPKSRNIHTSKSFTLIELLVVIAIIALLSSIVLASLNTARSKARDAKRLSDLREVEKALALYWSDNNSYPSTNGSWASVCAAWGPAYDLTGPHGYIPNLAPQYISILPSDPNQTQPDHCYIYRSDGTDYMFLVFLTVENLPVPIQLQRPSNTTEADYALFTPGASTW